MTHSTFNLSDFVKEFQLQGQQWAEDQLAEIIGGDSSIDDLASAEAINRAITFEINGIGGLPIPITASERYSFEQAFIQGARQGYYQFEPCIVWELNDQPDIDSWIFERIQESKGFPEGTVWLLRDEQLSDTQRDALRLVGSKQNGFIFKYYGDPEDIGFHKWCGWASRCFGLTIDATVKGRT
jgi:hypothetical protein